jgi:dienelactone hydrolase
MSDSARSSPSGPNVTAPVYAAFFLGQGGYVFSMGIASLARQARTRGIEADVYAYTEVDRARANVGMKREHGSKIALIGYSLGCTTATYLAQLAPSTDLVCCIAESSLGENHPIDNAKTKRSVLFTGPDFLSDAGERDAFDRVVPVDVLPIPIFAHLSLQFAPTVVNGVLAELAKLKGN